MVNDAVAGRDLVLRTRHIYIWAVIVTIGFCVAMFDAIARNDIRSAMLIFGFLVLHIAVSPIVAIAATETVRE